MDLLGSRRRTVLVASVVVLGSIQMHSCSSDNSGGGGNTGPGGSTGNSGGANGSSASSGGGGKSTSAGNTGSGSGGHGTGGASTSTASSTTTGAGGHGTSSSSSSDRGGSSNGSGGDSASSGGSTTAGAGGSSTGTDAFTVSIVQSSKDQATDIDGDEVESLVKDAVGKAGGLDFIKSGQTVVLKPNLLTSTSDSMRMTLLPVTTNGITADWRLAKAVAELVRDKVGSSGKILVMEGSTENTTQAFTRLGYTTDNFGTLVDEFIALEGASCSDTNQDGLVKKTTTSGNEYWFNKRYAEADIIISLPVLKNHLDAGVTGGVKNVAIGATPGPVYGDFANGGCTREQKTLIPHGTHEDLSKFIYEYYSLKPVDFVVMDGLQGVQHGPLPAWSGVTTADYAKDTMNMRLVLAGRNAVALDTISALVMKCDPTKVKYLSLLEADGFGTTDTSKITVVGKQVSEVAKTFLGTDLAGACTTP